MGLGTALAFVGGGISAGTQALGANSQKKAAKRAAELAAQTNRENNALAEKFYDRNAAVLSPWQQQGQAANSMFNAALGLPAYAAQAQPSAFAPGAPAPGSAVPAPLSAFAPTSGGDFGEPEYRGIFSALGQARAGNPANPGDLQAGLNMQQTAATPQVTAAVPAPNPMSAFNAFKNSTGYQFRMDQGLGALQKAFGRSLDSGASVKSALRFGQGLGSEEYGKWMQLLDNQQRLGFGAASAQVGVNQNMASTLTANNNAGSSAAINARLYQGNANANMWQGIGSSFGKAASMFGGGF